ncbi:MAG: discoidin domain-containing protein, partial [Phycisphaerae bacterium]
MLKKKFIGTLLCLVVALSFSATSAIGADILFIVADPTVASYPNDALIKNFLEGLGHTVTYFDDGEMKAAMAAAAAAADLVYISESCGSGSIHSKINEIEVPMIAGEPWGWDEMGLTHGGGAGTELTSPDITIVNPGHFLAAGLSGTVTVLTDITGPDGIARFANGIAGSQATVIATAQTGDFIYVYEKGAALAVPPADGTPQIAADIRICLGFDYRCHVLFNENAYALVEAAVNYGLGILAPPGNAKKPYPADVATDVPRDAVLSWTPGDFANTHDVYFGTVFDDVNNADRTNPLGVLASQNQDANTYDPVGLLELGQTYYWRVDEVNAPPDFTVYKGAVWQFTAEPFAYPIAGTSITATASSFFSEKTRPENTINGSGLDENDLHSKEEAGIWLSSMAGAQPTWIQYEFDGVYKLYEMWVWNFNQAIEPVVGFGFKDVTIEYSTNGTDWAVLADVPEFAQAPGQNGYAYNTTVDFGGTLAKYVKLTANSNWGGLMPQYGLSEVRFLHIPVVAREPDPASGTTDVNVDNVTLSWRAGREAASHNLYFSTDEQAVIDETISAVSIPADSSYANYNTGELVLSQSYYWKVNEVNEAETPATWQGEVLNFSTQEYLVVDDIEDYNDFEPDRIFDTWIDGWDVPANGSQVGSAEPPFAEQTIVHSGKQSMPLSYDNTTASYSEATANVANLKVGRDWAKYGIKTLSLWFYGNPTNAAEQMYVKLNGSKVTYDGDADNITR